MAAPRGGGGGSGTTAPAAQTLNYTQIYALARNAGLSVPDAIVATAIAMAESSGRTAVTSANPDGGVNVGVWQLDTKGVGAGYTVAQLQDPFTNAKVMAKGSAKGTNWSQWATYADGTYTKFLFQAQDAAASEQKGGSNWLSDALKGIAGAASDVGKDITGAVGNLLSLPSQVTDFLSALEQPVKAAMWLVDPANWARIVAGIFGFMLLAAGLIALGMSA